jgi:MFS family permease
VQMKKHLGPLAAIIGAAGLFQLSNGILTTIIPFRLGAAETSGIATSAVATAYSVGFLLGCLKGTSIISSVGHIRAFAGFAAVTAATTLMLEISPNPLLWFGIRVVQGACLAGLFTVADSWIADCAPNEVRGRVLATYSVLTTFALMLGQLLLNILDSMSFVIVMVVSGLFSFAVVPVSLTRAASPKPPELLTINPKKLYKSSPVAVLGCFVVGAIGAAMLNMIPFYLSQASIPADHIGLYVGSIYAVRLLLQWPVGRLSDIMDRRVIIIAAGTIIVGLAAGLGILIPFDGRLYYDSAYEALKWPLIGMVGSLGACSLLLYSVCIAQAQGRTSSENRVAVTSTLLMIWSSGSIGGLLALGLLMDAIGPSAIFWYTGALGLVLVIHAGWRVKQRPPASVSGKHRFFPMTSALVGNLEPRPPDESKI